MIARRLFGISLLTALVAAVVAVRCLVPVVAPDPPAATPVPPVVVVTVPAATATPTATMRDIFTVPSPSPELVWSTPQPTATSTTEPTVAPTQTPAPGTRVPPERSPVQRG